MSVGRRVAARIRWLVLAPGLVLTPFVLPTSVIVVLLVSTTLVVGIAFTLDTEASRDDGGVRPLREYCSSVLGPAAAAGAAVVSLAAVATISVAMALLLLPVLLLCSPRMHVWVPMRSVRSVPDAPVRIDPTVPSPRRPSTPARATIDPERLTRLTDDELCLAWRTSFITLQATRSPMQRSRVVSWRHACLDELESRHPAALAAWLGSGARAASGPERFLPPGPDRAA